MADPLVRRAKKWTYLTWCDLRNHPLMLVGALIGAIVFVIYTVNSIHQGDRISVIEKTVKVPRRCTVERLPTFPQTVLLTCVPASKQEVARAKARERQRAARAARRAGKAHAPRSPKGGLVQVVPESPNGNPGITPSPSRPPHSSRPPPSDSPSGGGSEPSTPSPPPNRAVPGITTPPLGPVPSLTVPLPSPSLPPLPRTSGQLTGR